MGRYPVRGRKQNYLSSDPDINFQDVPSIVGYARVSTFSQADAFQALKQQIDRLTSADVPLVLRDIQSGFTLNRESRKWFDFIWEAIGMGLISELVVTRIDRLSRSGLVSQELFHHLKSNGCKLRSLDEDFDFSNKFIYDLLSSLSEDYSNKLSLRVRRGYEYARKFRRVHIPAFGFRIEDYTPVPDHTPFLCLLSDKMEYSEVDIALSLVDFFLSRPEGLRATCIWAKEKFGKNFFYPSSLSRWLQGYQIVGDIAFRTKSKSPIIYRDNHTPLISRERQSLIKKKLQLNNRRRGGGVEAAKSSIIHPYTGLVVCAECLHKAKLVKNSQNGIIYRYYGCRHPKQYGCGNTSYLPFPVLEDTLIRAISNRVNVIASQIANLNSSPAPSPPPMSEEEEQIRSRLTHLKPLQNQGDSAIDDLILNSEARLAEIEESNNSAPSQNLIEKKKEKLYNAYQFLSDLHLHFFSMYDSEKEELLQLVIDQILFSDREIKNIKFRV